VATPSVNPWNLDEYARYLHHTMSYLMTKSKAAEEKDDIESVERIAGKAGYLLDKVVALVKVRAVAIEARMDDVSDPDPDPLIDPRLPKPTKDKLTAELAKRETQLAEKRAKATVWNLEGKILDLDKDREVSVLRGVLNSVRD
jgi:hypothetical protein